ncbi:MAG: DUF1904 domain-containing protein [Myxococcota bacterium]|jgi:hypothetical protein|nr:DUF1904 domain-containing protein [Myxococcota bacterium]
MPRIITHAVPVEAVQEISADLARDIAVLLEIPRDHIVIQVSSDVFVEEGQIASSYPFVEVCLFDRGHEKEDEIARIVTRHLRASGYSCVEVYLTRLEKRRYYENGQPF